MLQLGPIAEYLLTLSRPGGGRLVTEDGIQVYIPIFLPNTILTLSVGPIASDYAQIIVGLTLGPQMVPSAFSGYISLWGGRPMQARVTATFTNLNTFGTQFLWVTEAEPSFLYMENVSGLNQVFDLVYISLRITTAEDLEMVQSAIEDMSTSKKMEALQKETNSRLEAMAGGR